MHAEQRNMAFGFFHLLDGLADLGRWLDEERAAPKVEPPDGASAEGANPVAAIGARPTPRRVLDIGGIEAVRALASGDGARPRKRGRVRKGKGGGAASPN